MKIVNKLKKAAPKMSKRIKSADKTGDKIIPVNWQSGDRVPVNSQDETLLVEIPKGRDFRDCRFLVRAKVDVLVLYSETNSRLEISIPTTDATGADAPVEVNLTILPPEGDDPPPE